MITILSAMSFELALLKEALRQNKPVMAICRGLQLVNVAFGGTLNQYIEKSLAGLAIWYFALHSHGERQRCGAFVWSG